MTKTIEEWDFDDDILTADGFDECIIGKDYQEGRAVYSIERIIETLMTRDGMDMEEAMDYFGFNIGGAHLGEKTPLYVWQGETYHDSVEKVQE